MYDVGKPTLRQGLYSTVCSLPCFRHSCRLIEAVKGVEVAENIFAEFIGGSLVEGLPSKKKTMTLECEFKDCTGKLVGGKKLIRVGPAIRRSNNRSAEGNTAHI